MPASNDILARQAAKGDHEALIRLLERHGAAVRRKLVRKIPPRWKSLLPADDVIQQTYIDAFLDIGRFDADASGSFAAWMTTMAERNLHDALTMLDAEKHGKDWPQVEPGEGGSSFWGLYELLSGSGSTPSVPTARNEARRCLEEAIKRLPETYSHVVRMYDLEERSVGEVAAELKRSPGAVFMLRARAHRRLAEAMGQPPSI